jgi:hypothetical protein
MLIGSHPVLKGTELQVVDEFVEAHKKQSTSNTPAGQIDPTRGFLILIARLTARQHKRIFLLCHDFAISK